MLPDAIVINGASSAGKTSIAKALQEALSALYLNFSIDSVLYALPPSDLAKMIRGSAIDRREYDYDKLVRGYHAAAAGLLAEGNRLILDNAITKAEWKQDLKDRLSGLRSFWIGVTCSLSVLRERERRRGDRALGTAEREAAGVHEGFTYDIQVDASSATPEQCAGEIMNMLGSMGWR